jgi:hypothetical protein
MLLGSTAVPTQSPRGAALLVFFRCCCRAHRCWPSQLHLAASTAMRQCRCELMLGSSQQVRLHPAMACSSGMLVGLSFGPMLELQGRAGSLVVANLFCTAILSPYWCIRCVFAVWRTQFLLAYTVISTFMKWGWDLSGVAPFLPMATGDFRNVTNWRRHRTCYGIGDADTDPVRVLPASHGGWGLIYVASITCGLHSIYTGPYGKHLSCPTNELHQCAAPGPFNCHSAPPTLEWSGGFQ